LKGQRAIRKCFFLRGKRYVWYIWYTLSVTLSWYIDRYSVLPALSLGGILYSNIVEGSFNTESFTDFIKGLLDQMQPYPAQNSVIVMDNCRIHHAPAIREIIEERLVFIYVCIETADTLFIYI
jgi:hypothetical protein